MMTFPILIAMLMFFAGLTTGYVLFRLRSGSASSNRELHEKLQLHQQELRQYQKKVQNHLEELTQLTHQLEEPVSALKNRVQLFHHDLNPDLFEKPLPNTIETTSSNLTPPRDYALERTNEPL